MKCERIYGVVERNEYGRPVVVPWGQHGLLPGTVVEIRPIDEAPTPDVKEPKPTLPVGVAVVAA